MRRKTAQVHETKYSSTPSQLQGTTPTESVSCIPQGKEGGAPSSPQDEIDVPDDARLLGGIVHDGHLPWPKITHR